MVTSMKRKAAKDFIAVDKAEETPVSAKKVKRKVIISGSKEACEERGVVYLSNIPDGFFENEIRKFFGQFGAVTNIKVGRSRKTGNSRGYAFVEFRFKEVAAIVANTMNNYLMFERLMKCKLVPEEKIRPNMFKNKIDPQKPPGRKARQAAKKRVNAERDERQEEQRRRRQFGSLQKSAAKLRELGVDIDISLPEIEEEKKRRHDRLRKEGRTPVMAVDDSDLDITLKTPPNVRKIKSRNNSAANSAALTPYSAKASSLPLMAAMKKRKLVDNVKSKTPTIPTGMSKKKLQLFEKESKKSKKTPTPKKKVKQ